MPSTAYHTAIVGEDKSEQEFHASKMQYEELERSPQDRNRRKKWNFINE